MPVFRSPLLRRYAPRITPETAPTPLRSELIGIGDPATWPLSVRAIVEELAEQVERHPGFGGPDTFTSELSRLVGADHDGHAEGALRSALDTHLFVAYHATRLLAHEAEWIRAEGLLPLSDELRRRKLIGARAHHPELIDDDDVALLLKRGLATWDDDDGHLVRYGQLHVLAPLSDDDQGLDDILSAWGGESIAWAGEGDERCAAAVKRLTHVSVPTLVELAVAAQGLCGLWSVMVGNLLQLRHPWSDWVTQSAIPPRHVLDLIQPGNPRWPTRHSI